MKKIRRPKRRKAAPVEPDLTPTAPQIFRFGARRGGLQDDYWIALSGDIDGPFDSYADAESALDILKAQQRLHRTPAGLSGVKEIGG